MTTNRSVEGNLVVVGSKSQRGDEFVTAASLAGDVALRVESSEVSDGSF